MHSSYPTPTSPAVSAVMRGNRKTDTRPEIRLRSALHRAGLRYRKTVLLRAADTKARADIVFPGRRVAVFVDGCFWHSCPQHGTAPQANVAYWDAKLQGNVDRDRRVDVALTASGWSVVRVWEHEVLASLDRCVERIVRVLGAR